MNETETAGAEAVGNEAGTGGLETSGAPVLPTAARRAFVTLLQSRFITRSRHRPTWDALLTYEREIRERLADLFLHLVIDHDHEVAFKRQDPDEDAPKMLRRDRPLTRDASLLLIHLRKEHMYTDAADGPVVITRSQVAEFLRPFREDGDGDEARFERRVDSAIRAIVDLRLLVPDADADYLFTISPAVVPLIGADEMMRMEQHFVRAAEDAGSEGRPAEGPEPAERGGGLEREDDDEQAEQLGEEDPA